VKTPDSPNALVALVGRYVHKLACRAARGYGLDADDLAQEAFLILLERFGNYDPARAAASTFAHWQFRAALSRLLTYKPLVRGRRNRVVQSDEADQSADSRAVDGIRQVDARDELDHALAPCTRAERSVLLRRAAGESLDEIAAGRGVSKQRVSQIQLSAFAKIAA
jgi:RNA polymerase sigma factor (sigma-70 family)